MKPIFDTEQRAPAEYGDVLHLYRARMVSKPEPGDDRLQVRVIPHMIDIPETALLPYWPPFFKGQVITGITEAEDKKNAEYVWVAATPDFTMGFIMGPANHFEAADAGTKYSESYNFKDLLQGLIQRGICPAGTDYKSLYVQYWNPNYLEMVNIKTGDKYSILGNGTIFALHRNQIYMRVGAQEEGSTAKTPFSAIRISNTEINFVTNHFRVKADQITLGNKGLNLTAMSSSIPTTNEGVTFHPITSIKV
jgi:hypothetical protein